MVPVLGHIPMASAYSLRQRMRAPLLRRTHSIPHKILHGPQVLELVREAPLKLMLISINQIQAVLQIYKQVHHGYGGAYQIVNSLRQIIGTNGMALNG